MRPSGVTTNSTAEYGRLSVFGPAVMRVSGPSGRPAMLLNSLSKCNLPSRKASGARMSPDSAGDGSLSTRLSAGVYIHMFFPSQTISFPLGAVYSHRMRPGLRSSSIPLSDFRTRPTGV
jgi:hypothetical protein